MALKSYEDVIKDLREKNTALQAEKDALQDEVTTLQVVVTAMGIDVTTLRDITPVTSKRFTI